MTKMVGELVIERDQHRCVAWVTHHERARRGEQIHHRKPRRMGGSTAAGTNMAANLIYVCRACHEWIESHREASYLHGYLVNAHDDPMDVPMLYCGQRVVLLGNDGSVNDFVAVRMPPRA